MERALELSLDVDVSGPRRLAVGSLLAASSALARLAERVGRPGAVARIEALEVSGIELGGARRGAVYADGRLLGVLPGVERL